jgi:predicted dienelactone hydrolase
MYRKLLKRMLKTVAVLAVVGVAGIALILVWLRVEHGLPVTLPEPTGPFKVGRTVYHWVDTSRTDSLSPVPNQKRELIAWVWYPAAPKAAVMAADYQPAPWRAAAEPLQGVLMNKFFTRDLSLVRTHSIPDADLSPIESTYPIVLMKSGIGALATDYTTLAEDLASHGYVVVGSDSPYSTFVVVFPDGRVATRTPAGSPVHHFSPPERDRKLNELVAVWSADTRFELDQLERLNAADPSGKFRGRLNLQAVGVFGHSFGGATAAQFCHDDPRCKAGIDIDGAPFGSVIQEGLPQPFVFLLSDHGDASDAESRQIPANIQSIRGHNRDGCSLITLRDSRHFNFSDQSLLKDRYLLRIAGAAGRIGERRGLAITSAYLHTFFGVYLKGAPASSLQNLPSSYPELSLEHR